MQQPTATTLCLTLLAAAGLFIAQPAMAAEQSAAMHKTTPEGTGEFDRYHRGCRFPRPVPRSNSTCMDFRLARTASMSMRMVVATRR